MKYSADLDSTVANAGTLDCPLEYHYDFDVKTMGTVATILCVGKVHPTKHIACLGGTGGDGFDRDQVNTRLTKLPVHGRKQNLRAAYGR